MGSRPAHSPACDSADRRRNVPDHSGGTAQYRLAAGVPVRGEPVEDGLGHLFGASPREEPLSTPCGNHLEGLALRMPHLEARPLLNGVELDYLGRSTFNELQPAPLQTSLFLIALVGPQVMHAPGLMQSS